MKKIIIPLLAVLLFACEKSASEHANDSGNSIGRGGSTARFTISGNYMYTVDWRDLHIFNISNPSNPIESSLFEIGRDIETIFAMDTYLFIGSMSAVYIYDISSPLQPTLIHTFPHATACDPVVADAKYAYVTVRNNNIVCGGNVNELKIINIENIQNSFEAKTYIMEAPYGLGVDGNYLFVCDNGIKMFDNTDPLNLQLIIKIPEVDARDLIPYRNNLIVTATDGIYQYDYSTGTLILKNKISLQ